MSEGREPIKLLLADDDAGVLASGRMLFGDEGWEVVTTANVAGILRAVRGQQFDLVLMDMNFTRDTTSGKEGLEVLQQLHEADADLPVVVMTAWATVPLAVEAIKRGARDFVTKPWDNERVVQLLRQIALNTRAERGNRLLKEAGKRQLADALPRDFIAGSAAMRQLLEMIRRIGPSDANVLLLGENGTGKSVVAQLIHDHSSRADGPFISVNIGGLAEGVFESEVFGHVKGAFTDAKNDRAGRFELANGGTLFLDEIGNLQATQQNRMLRLLETGEFERVGSSRTIRADVRLISATNADLAAMVADKSFREDLYYRLNTVVMVMPALRDRRDDIVPMAEMFLGELARKYHKPAPVLAADARAALCNYQWPGNVRELKHAIERAVLMSPDEHISAGHLMLSAAPSAAVSQQLGSVDLEDMSMEDAEKLLMTKALRKHGGNVTKAASQLGMSRATFYRRLQDYRL